MLALVRCLPLIALFAGAPARTSADVTPRVLVIGRAIDDSVSPIEGAWVQLTSRATGRVLSVRTSSRGEYSFGLVDDDGYLDVLVRRIGYQPAHFTLSHQAGTDELIGNVQLQSLASTARVGNDAAHYLPTAFTSSRRVCTCRVCRASTV